MGGILSSNMKRIWVIVAVAALLILAGGIGVFFWQRSKKGAIVSPEASGGESAASAPQKILSWSDPAGFTFQYPEGVVIDKHDEDKENYAHIEFAHSSHTGSIIVWAKDTTAESGASWLKSQKTYQNATTLDSTLGEIEAVKALLTTPTRLMVTATVDEGIVFYVEGKLDDSDFWTPVYETITNSFAFTSADQPAAPGGSSEDIEEAVDEEEIIE